jgi:hypothetical protein
LFDYCRESRWSGYDPYDALNSGVFKTLPVLDFKLFRIAATQLLKRSPIDLRSMLGVPKTQNPKALALFLTACVNLARSGLLDDIDAVEKDLVDSLIALRAPEQRHWCWGYSFPWQTRTILVPRGAANLVCTTFVANALLDAYDRRRERPHLEMATSAAEYIVDELYWTDGDGYAGFRYPLPASRARVHNANFLAAALLCRVYHHTGEQRFLVPALKAARYSAARQCADGSWAYGEFSSQRWKDNFHTGFNLCALRAVERYAPTAEFADSIRRGFAFYRQHFFRSDGAPKYFHDRAYPLDVHSVAQSIITMTALRDLHEESMSMAHATLRWAMANLWDERGFFYYRKLKFATIKISYMRWSQAWMLAALSTLAADGRWREPASMTVAVA